MVGRWVENWGQSIRQNFSLLDIFAKRNSWLKSFTKVLISKVIGAIDDMRKSRGKLVIIVVDLKKDIVIALLKLTCT